MSANLSSRSFYPGKLRKKYIPEQFYFFRSNRRYGNHRFLGGLRQADCAVLVRLRRWDDLHAKQDAQTAFSVLCCEVHLERDKVPKAL